MLVTAQKLEITAFPEMILLWKELIGQWMKEYFSSFVCRHAEVESLTIIKLEDQYALNYEQQGQTISAISETVPTRASVSQTTASL